MKCERIIDRYLECDNRSAMPLSLYLHLTVCPSCRKEIHRLKRQFESLRNSSPYAIKNDMSDVIMKAIYKSGENYGKSVSFARWLTAGFMIVIGRAIFSYSDSFAWLQITYGRSLDLPLNLILGATVSLYSIFFIIAKLEDLQKVIPYLNEKIKKFT